MEDAADVVEISDLPYPPPSSRSTKKRSSKQAEIIDVVDDEHDDVIILDEEASTRSRNVINLDTSLWYIDCNRIPESVSSASYDRGHSSKKSKKDDVSSRAGNVDILRRFNLFKHFDIVEDYSDHLYKLGSRKRQYNRNIKSSHVEQSTNKWTKRIQQEWKLLENNLPDGIYVRGYESRMDLMRAVIIGADGTPYHDGLFFFDIFFPSNYPDVPPEVRYLAGGLRINPNLYDNGTVCLSILWTGKKEDYWQPGASNMMQVLLSIQALVLNKKPYFNEPAYKCEMGTPHGETMSRKYSENTFLLSLKRMVGTMRKPPKHFEQFVKDHFHNRAEIILVACKAYMGGAEVGCLSKGGIQDVDEGYKSCSPAFQTSLPEYMKMLVTELRKIPGISETVGNFS